MSSNLVPSILSINIQPLCNLCHSLRREESSIFLDNLINLLSAQSLGLLTAKNLFYFDSPNHRFVTIIKTVQFKNTITRSLFHSKLWPFSVMHQLTSKQSLFLFLWYLWLIILKCWFCLFVSLSQIWHKFDCVRPQMIVSNINMSYVQLREN